MQPSTLPKRSPGTTTATTMKLLLPNPKILLPSPPKPKTPSRPHHTHPQPPSNSPNPTTHPTNPPRPHPEKSLSELQTERPVARKTNTASRIAMRATISSVEPPVERPGVPRKKGDWMSRIARKSKVMTTTQTGSRIGVPWNVVEWVQVAFLPRELLVSPEHGAWDYSITNPKGGCHHLSYLPRWS